MPLAPPVLEYLAGLTAAIRPAWDIRLVNANVEDISLQELNADLVGITILTHQARWAYRTADALRQRGITVFMGGPHPTVLPEDAATHADSVLVGEAEGVLEQLFLDFERGVLKDRYYGTFLPLEQLPFPKRDLLNGYVFHSFSTSRGCPHSCKFCTTPTLHGKQVRYRPTANVISDIASFKHKMWFCTDADIWGPDVTRAIELFKEMHAARNGMYWVGEGSIASVQHARGGEMLSWARRSGLMQVWVGWESFSTDILKEYGAGSKMLSAREDALKKIRDHGIDVVLFMMLGSKNESLQEYARVVEVCDRLPVTPHPVMVVPYPGTVLSEELKSDIVHAGEWDYYDGMHSILTQQNGDNEAHETELRRLWLELFTYSRMFKRLAGISVKGFPSAHIASGIVQYALRKAFREYAAEDIKGGH